MKVQASAPGKLMILGEHAAVYGYPCIVAAVDKRIRVDASINPAKEDYIETDLGQDNRFVKTALNLFKKKYNIRKNVKIYINSEFPPHLGLGSSAAVTVATIKALSEIFKIPLTEKGIFRLSYQTSFKTQGTGSGVDVAASTFGGIIFYKKKGEIIKKLNTDKIPLIAVYSGVKADTSKLVRRVENIYKNKKQKKTEIFKKIERLVQEGKKAIENRQWQKLGKIMNGNHILLKDLGVSTPRLDLLIEAALKAGAWGAKISGAGGGDCIIVIASLKKRKKIEENILDKGGQILDINFSQEGVRVE